VRNSYYINFEKDYFMKTNRRLRVIVLVVLGLAIAGGAAWYYLQTNAKASGPVTASGTLQATSTRLSPEVGGVVTEINAAESQEVKTGQLLAKINDLTAQQQLSQAKSALASAYDNLSLAQSSYDLVVINNSDEQHQSAVTAAQLDVTNAQLALKALYDNADLMASQTLQEIAALDKTRDKDTQYRDNLRTTADQADINAAWAQVVIAKDRRDKAQKDYDPYANKSTDNVTRAFFLAKLSAAQQRYDSAVNLYNNLVGKSNQYELTLADANVVLDESRLADAKRRYNDLQNGPSPDDLALAQARLTAAQARLTAIQDSPSAEQIAVAQDQVDVARAQVASATEQVKLLEIQLQKYTIPAPSDGIILSKGVNVGETVSPGAVMFEIGDLHNLQVTVYLPEEQFGRVKPGDQASVKVDAYPNRTFTAHVDRLANQAEFTPRNVQTAEGRHDTVFAVYLSMDNPDLALMPGMWADVTFNLN
jgi:HlyD family secretion protein